MAYHSLMKTTNLVSTAKAMTTEALRLEIRIQESDAWSGVEGAQGKLDILCTELGTREEC